MGTGWDNIKLKKFNNIDDAVTLIQRCFRKYLNKIHNTNSEIMKLIHERKKNILQNYNIYDNQSIFENKDISKNKNNYNNTTVNDKYKELQDPFNKKFDKLNEDIIVNYNGIKKNYEEISNSHNNNIYNNYENYDDKNTLENDII